MVVHVRLESLYIPLPSSAKQQREMAKLHVTQWLIFRVFLLNRTLPLHI